MGIQLADAPLKAKEYKEQVEELQAKIEEIKKKYDELKNPKNKDKKCCWYKPWTW